MKNKKQKIVSDATSTIVAATRIYSQNKQAEAEAQKQAAEAQALEKLKAEGGADWEKYNSTDDYVTKQNLLKNALPAYKDASDQAQTWGMGGNSSRALNAVTTAITAALGGQADLQVVTNTLAPYAAQVIGKEFGHGADKNTAAQLVSHAILGATLAYINGGDPTAGGSAAVASEAAAIYLTNQYKDDPRYQNENGEFIPNLLPEDVKTQIRDLTAAIGAVAGGTVGDSAFNAQIAAVVGQNAVENNQAGAHKFAKKQDDQYNNLCAQNGISVGQCSTWTGQRILNNSKELAMIIIPTEPYELIPMGKGVSIVSKVTGKVVAKFSDVKQAEKVLENIKASQAARESSNFNIHIAKSDQVKWGYKADNWSTNTLKKGDYVYGGIPGQSAYYTTEETLKSAKGSATSLFQSLQVTPHKIFGYRTEMGKYEVLKDMTVPFGKVKANPDLGNGGGDQFFIKPYDKNLKLVDKLKLEK